MLFQGRFPLPAFDEDREASVLVQREVQKEEALVVFARPLARLSKPKGANSHGIKISSVLWQCKNIW